MTSQLVYILTDSVTNSVFEGQVLQPLLNKLEVNPDLTVTLLSFEGNILNRKDKKALNDRHPRLRVRLFYRFRFWFLNSQYFCVLIFRHALRHMKSYSVVARGPLAGWIALRGARIACKKITIQARGLMAEEYWYEKRNTGLSKIVHYVRYNQFYRLEKKAYSTLPKKSPYTITIETVSKALSKYLVSTYGTPQESIIIAQQDIPPIIPAKQVTSWKNETRNKLGIDSSRYVYCYAGSAKSWQCPQQIITFFKEVKRKDQQSFLLIFSQDKEVFTALLHKNNVSPEDYLVTKVKSQELPSYLSAADAGIIFRDEHILNWVSRPTKALEYKSVGLKIIHNNTVDYITQMHEG